MGTIPQAPATQRSIQTAQLITAMLKSGSHVSDLIFSPGRAPQIEVSGELVELKFKGWSVSARTTRDLSRTTSSGKTITRSESWRPMAPPTFRTDCPASPRFRVNVFRQRGTYAIVMRVIPMDIPGFEKLNLPAVLREVVSLRNGIVLVTGPTGSGKSSTLAAVLEK